MHIIFGNRSTRTLKIFMQETELVRTSLETIFTYQCSILLNLHAVAPMGPPPSRALPPQDFQININFKNCIVFIDSIFNMHKLYMHYKLWYLLVHELTSIKGVLIRSVWHFDMTVQKKFVPIYTS